MPDLRPLAYIGVGALIVAGVAFGPRHIGEGLRGVGQKLGLGKAEHRASPQEKFTRDHAGFDALAKDLEACKGSGLLSLYADGRAMGTITDTVNCGDPAPLARRLVQLDIDWVNIDGQGTGHYQLTFVLKADKEPLRASRSSFDYDPDAASRTDRRRTVLDAEGQWHFTRGR